MKTTKNYTRIIIFLLLAVSLKFTACEQEDLDFYPNCLHCLDDIPEYDTLWVSLTIDDENPFVPLKFYVGTIDEGETDWIDTAYSENFWLISEVNVQYAVKATYVKDGEPFIAVDSDKIRIVNGSDDCYDPCFLVRAGTLDVRIKEE